MASVRKRGVNIKYLVVFLAGVGMAVFAFYYTFFKPNPVEPEALHKITGILGEVQLEEGKSPRLLFQIDGHTVTFVVGTSFEALKLKDFLANEFSSGETQITIVVNKQELENPRVVPLDPGQELVEVYSLASNRAVYLTLEQSRAIIASSKRTAMYLGIFMILCVVVIFFVAFPDVTAYGEIEVPLDNVFYGYQPFMWKTDRFFMIRATPHQLEAAYIGGQVMSPEPFDDPLMFARKDLVDKYVSGEGTAMPWSHLDHRNLLFVSQDVERIEFSPKTRAWVAPHPHVGTLYFYLTNGRCIQFILMGRQALNNIRQLRRDNHFNLTE